MTRNHICDALDVEPAETQELPDDILLRWSLEDQSAYSVEKELHPSTPEAFPSPSADDL